MAFIAKIWKNDPNHDTPIEGSELTDLEVRVTDYSDSQLTAEAAQRLADDEAEADARDAAITAEIAARNAAIAAALSGVSGYTDADVKRVAAALASGDKVAWEYPTGTDVVELWGDRTAAGFATVYTNNFNGVPPNDVSAFTTIPNSNNLVPTIVGGKLKPSFTGGGYWDTGMWYLGGYATTGDFRIGAVITANGASSAQLAGFTAVTADNRFVGVDFDFNGGFIVFVRRNTTPSGTELSSRFNGTLPTSTTSGYARFTKAGNVLTYEWWQGGTSPTGTPTSTGSFTLTSTNATDFGLGVNVRPGVFIGTNNTPMAMDDLLLESMSPESRDLYLAITPASGTRAVKRIYGSSGSSIFRSDFAQLNAGGTAISIPIYTLATRPTAAASGASALIFVSDAATGQKLQISDGAAWQDWSTFAALASPALTGTPTAPTAVAGTNTTQLATTAYADRASRVLTPNTQAVAAYTLVLADIGKFIEGNIAGGFTLTVPADATTNFPIGTRIPLRRIQGAFTIHPAVGVTIPNKVEAAGTSDRTISALFGEAFLTKRAANTWVLTGDIA